MYRMRNLRIRLSEWSGQDDRGSPARLGSEGMYILRKVRKLLPGREPGDRRPGIYGERINKRTYEGPDVL